MTEQYRKIAEFMGWTFTPIDSLTSKLFDVRVNGEPNFIGDEKDVEDVINSLNYSKSWDRLMPVVEKISTIKCESDKEDTDTFYPRTFGMLNEDNKPMFRYNRGFLYTDDTLIMAAFKATVEFIEWYNSQTKQS